MLTYYITNTQEKARTKERGQYGATDLSSHAKGGIAMLVRGMSTRQISDQIHQVRLSHLVEHDVHRITTHSVKDVARHCLRQLTRLCSKLCF